MTTLSRENLISSSESLKMNAVLRDPLIIEKCTLFLTTVFLALLIIWIVVQVGNLYSFKADQLLAEVDAFLLNIQKDSLTVDLLGKFQQTLFQKSRVNIIEIRFLYFVILHFRTQQMILLRENDLIPLLSRLQ
jgi:hypothetical protein